MKKWLLFVASVLLVACNSNEDLDTPQKLKLSVSEETVYIDELDYSFDIISGNGDYQLEVSGAKATLEGNHVKLELFSDAAELMITDKEEQSVSLKVLSSNDALKPLWHEFRIPFGNITKSKLNFGTGKYSVLRSTGSAATLVIDSQDRAVITSVEPGRSSFLVADQRGITGSIVVNVDSGWVLTSNELTVTVEGNQYYYFPLQYGAGGWRLISPTNDDGPSFKPWLVVMPKGEGYWQDMLQIYAAKEDTEPVVYTLQDKEKNKATITVCVKP